MGKFRPSAKSVRLVVAAVAVGVFEHADASARLAVAIHAERIVRHLHDPEAATLIPIESHGIEHQRLRGDKFHVEARGHVDLFQRFLGRERLLVLERCHGRGGSCFRRARGLAGSGVKFLRFRGGQRAIEQRELREVPLQRREMIAARCREKSPARPARWRRSRRRFPVRAAPLR